MTVLLMEGLFCPNVISTNLNRRYFQEDNWLHYIHAVGRFYIDLHDCESSSRENVGTSERQ